MKLLSRLDQTFRRFAEWTEWGTTEPLPVKPPEVVVFKHETIMPDLYERLTGNRLA